MKPAGRWLPFWGAFAAALALRLAFLDARPLHHDEGVNAWFVSKLLEGYQYAYDPAKFHGPFLVFLVLPFFVLLGQSVFISRLPVALASALMVPLLLPLRRRLGMAGVTAAAWLLALSPSFVAYGRDLIHETFLAALTLALVAAVSSWLETRREERLVLAAFCLGLLATVKETYAVTLAILAIAAVLARIWTRGRPDLRELWSGVRAARRDTAVRAAAAFGVPYVLLYTSFFTHPWGLPGSIQTFFIWSGKGLEGAGHGKPWDYFPGLLLAFEPVTVLCALVGGWLALRRRDAFGTFCALWAAGELAAYSLLRYKTPWLGLNILLPAALAAGVLFREIFSGRVPAVPRAVLAGTFLLGVAWEGWRAVEVSFRRFDDTRLALVYVPTHRDVDALVAEVREAAGRIPPGGKPAVRILGRYAWPLPWYLRDLPGMEYRHDLPPEPDGDVLIVDREREVSLRPLLRQRYRRREYLLRPGEPVAVYVNERLTKPR
ncbi:MAG TPA: flippase activity-associated protein Agl23 [Thermoanaerobaculia bacterium]|nr:flippase activity-associated protein Agl23 [Thermoanaerobaculia bacterium]